MHLFQVVEKKIETETIITTSKIIKYSAETSAINQKAPDIATDKLQAKASDTQPKVEDVPPKPPPRTFPVIEMPKREVEVPKSTIVAADQSKGMHSELTVRHFEFPEVSKLENASPTVKSSRVEFTNDSNVKNFDPKIASTPTLTSDKIDYDENDELVPVKPIGIIESNKVVGENKVSPTNSVVRAVIHTSKSKGGNKKKNSVVASKE